MQRRFRERTVHDVNDTLMQSALREMRAIFTSPVRLLVMASAIALLTISGPFGTFDYDLQTRLIYWAVVVVASYSAGQIGASLADRAMVARQQGLGLRILVMALCASIPASIVVIAVTWVVDAASAPHVLVLWFYVFAVSLALVGVIVVTNRQDMPEQPSDPAILERLPLPQRGRLLHIAVSDHYVDVTTDKGTTLVLMRLSDAIRETAPIKGLQVHRSHWVALDAVRRSLRQGGKPMLELENGTLVPVSRTYLADARAAGLLVS